MNAVIRLGRAEFRKMLTTRALPVSAAVAVALTLVTVIANAAQAGRRGLPPLGTQAATYQMLKLAAVTSVIMLIIGVLASGGEFRHGTIIPALLVTPRRRTVFGVKLAVVAAIGALLGAVVFGIGLLAAMVMTRSQGAAGLPGPVGRLYAGTVLSTVCFGMIGVALGAITRNTVAAIVSVIAWVLFVEQVVLQALVPSIEKYLPVGAAMSLTSPPGAAGMLSPAAGAAVLTGYAVLLFALASLTTLRRDVG